ncbi:DJ-1/PfpI family protein [Rhodopila sp.]|uniref:DJ-1/PfpI family protein n=1 Tax=Rhodopila sp. TaxID=2480087 RepID=UPI002C3CA636|nr:DJ-1/PfpI family protein [Rhodopila sp.]HVZ06328.1 DJ-1/PfpI family protein [Rhodopila sp.]
MPRIRIGLLAFPGVTQLDLSGPAQVFASMPEAEVMVIWKTRDPIKADGGLTLVPDVTFANCPRLDVICVPGGYGVLALMEDPETLACLRAQADQATYVGSICTGSLVLGAAGLLHGRKATTHWGWTDLLVPFGAIPTPGRVVRDGKYFTGGGVTAGIDFALTMVAELAGPDAAQAIQLGIEYAPAPPFNAGNPDTADPALVAAARTRMAARRAEREAAVKRAAAAMVPA